jgi:hypothetical protein
MIKLKKMYLCLEKISIDIADFVDIVIAVDHVELSKLREWLDSKMVVSDSIISLMVYKFYYRALEL